MAILKAMRLAGFLAAYEELTRLSHSHDLTAQIEELERRKPLQTGIKALDDTIDGFRSNQLIVIKLRP